jgi:predicted alpha/beta hydrolase
MTSRVVVAADGWRLGCAVRAPEGVARGVAVLWPAMMCDARTLSRGDGGGVAGVLARAGWETWAVDFRGHGASGPLPAAGGVWSYDDLVYRDVPAVLAAAREAAAGRPVVVIGHSLGAHVSAASLAAGAARADAWVGVSANAWLPQLEPSVRVRWAKGAALAAFEAVSAACGRFPARAAGVGSADEATPYVSDLRRFWRTGRWGSADGHDDWLALAESLTLPRLSVLGVGDPLLARADAAVAWSRHLGPRGAEVWLVGDGRYGVAARPGHMDLLTDPRAAGWWDPLVDWLGRATSVG